ncbi:MAG: alpha/beta fold hydrolase [Ilumatobacteraceae bacterium]
MATLQHGQDTIGYDVLGDPAGGGPVVLLYHGTTQDRAAWDFVLAAFPEGHDLSFVKLEFPGAGESSMPTGPLTVDQLVDGGLAVMGHLGVDAFHVAGYSLGAVAALATAALATPQVRTVTSLCGWALSDARMVFTFDLWKRLIAADPELFVRYAVADGFSAPAIGALEPAMADVIGLGIASIQPGSAAQLDLDMTLDITSLLGQISSPALIIGAEDDRWVDVSHSRSLAEAIPGARLEVLPAGHVVIQELPADVARLLHAHVTA